MFTIIDDDGNVSLVEEPSPDVIHTYADYYNWKFVERVELFKGVVYQLLTPNTVHQLVLGRLFIDIGNYLEKKKSKVFFAPFDIRLFAKAGQPDDEITTVVQPDICVINDLSKLDERGFLGAPDMMIEILLPGNSRKEVRLKYELYEVKFLSDGKPIDNERTIRGNQIITAVAGEESLGCILAQLAAMGVLVDARFTVQVTLYKLQQYPV